MIEELINNELVNANKKFPLFASWHEAYAVILEEAQEAQEEVSIMEELEVECLWCNIRSKKASEADRLKSIEAIRGYAVRGIEELIQVAAMCDKAMISLGEEKK